MKHLFVVGGFTVRDRDPNAVLSLFEVFDPLVCEDYQHPLAVHFAISRRAVALAMSSTRIRVGAVAIYALSPDSTATLAARRPTVKVGNVSMSGASGRCLLSIA